MVKEGGVVKEGGGVVKEWRRSGEGKEEEW